MILWTEIHNTFQSPPQTISEKYLTIHSVKLGCVMAQTLEETYGTVRQYLQKPSLVIKCIDLCYFPFARSYWCYLTSLLHKKIAVKHYCHLYFSLVSYIALCYGLLISY